MKDKTKDFTILILVIALCLTLFLWTRRENMAAHPSLHYENYNYDELSWVIEGRMEALYKDFEDLIQAIVRQKQLLPD